MGNSSTVSLPDVGIAMQDFDTVSSQGGLTAFDEGVPFELLGVVQDDDNNSSFVTLPGMNESVIGR